MQPPPDISGLLGVLNYYFGALDTESCEELLRTRLDGTYLIRDGAQPDVITISYVQSFNVFHLPVKFDIHGLCVIARASAQSVRARRAGFFTNDSGHRMQTIEEILQYAAAMRYPLSTALTHQEANAQVSLAR